MQINKDQLKSILQNRPYGSDPKKLIEGLIDRGYSIEGLDPLTTSVYQSQKTGDTPYVDFERDEPQSLWGKARDFAAKIVGGGKLAEATGQAIASPGAVDNLASAIETLTQQQTNILGKIRVARENGEDDSRLMQLLELNGAEINRMTNTVENYSENLATPKQVVGSAARLAGTLAGGAIAGQASRLTGAGQAVGAASGAARGALAGLGAGAIEGGIQGAGIAAEQDASTEDIVLSGLLGGASGAALGGAIGAGTGAISGGLKARTIRRENFLKELASPALSKKERIAALKQGRLQDPGFLRKAEVAFSGRDEKLADAISDVVDPKATLSQNVDALRQRISSINNEAIDYLSKNKVPFNTRQLKSQLETAKGDLNIVFASDRTAERTYDAVSEALIKNVSKKDARGLFLARQDFDQIPAIKKLLESSAAGENVKKQIVLAVRKAANNYVSDLVPDGSIIQSALQKEHLIFEALGNIAEKGQAIVGKNKLQLISQEYPLMKWILGGAAAGASSILGARLAGGVGAGGAIIGSTD